MIAGPCDARSGPAALGLPHDPGHDSPAAPAGAQEAAAPREPSPQDQVTLLELLDRVLDKGVVLSGDITLSVADVDLVYVGLRVLLSSVEAAARAAGEGDTNQRGADGPPMP
jgi:hypothetical protein